MMFSVYAKKTIKNELGLLLSLEMNYAYPEVLVDTDWVSNNPPNESRKLVEVDYDPENAYRKGHIKDASLIWWKRDINDALTRDIINKKQFEDLMKKKWNKTRF